MESRSRVKKWAWEKWRRFQTNGGFPEDEVICGSPTIGTNKLSSSGVGVTEPISSIPLFSRFFTITKTLVTYWISPSYLTGVTTAVLWWHLSNVKVIKKNNLTRLKISLRKEIQYPPPPPPPPPPGWVPCEPPHAMCRGLATSGACTQCCWWPMTYAYWFHRPFTRILHA